MKSKTKIRTGKRRFTAHLAAVLAGTALAMGTRP